MAEEKRRENRWEKTDAFWDLGNLMPQKKPLVPFAKDTEAVPIQFGEKEEGGARATPIPPPDPERLARARAALSLAEKKTAQHAQPSSIITQREEEYLLAQRRRDELEARYRAGKGEGGPKPKPTVTNTDETVYTPQNPLIRKVTIRPMAKSGFDPIRQGALSAFEVMCDEEDFTPVPYYTAVPSYKGMTEGQRRCYLAFRNHARRGIYPEIDASYVYLYLYETLNLLPSPITPDIAMQTLLSVWAAYRKTESRLDYLIPEWICDLSLCYRIEPPSDFPTELLASAIRTASLKEFYLGAKAEENSSAFARAVFRYGLNYRWQDSKFITQENKSVFTTHIPAAFLYAFSRLEEAEKDSDTFGICQKQSLRPTMVRQAFAGSSFATSIKHTLLIEHDCCARSIELRFMATDLVKYAENQVRRMLGIKSRFHTSHLDPRLKVAADEYFAPFFPRVIKEKKPIERIAPEYEALYEAKSEPFSPSLAGEIETSGWQITKKLVDAFETEEDTPPPTAPAPIPEEKEEKDGEDTVRQAFSLLLSGNTELTPFARQHGLLTLTLVEKMNEQALLLLSDIAVEQDGEGWRLIADYKEDIAKWLNS